MRLPWPFGRRTSPDGPPAPGAEGGGDEASAPASAPHAPTRAWATLPPIQRATGPAPLVAPSAPFLAEVPGHVALPPIVQPLGHDASPAAPAGIVVARARPVASLTSHAELAPRPVQRRRAVGSQTSNEAVPGPAEPAVAPPSGASGPSSAGAAVEPEPEPVRQLAIVPPAATVTPPSRPLTRTPPALLPVSRSVARPAMAGTPAGSPPATPQVTGRPVPGLGAPLVPGADAPALDLPRTVSRWAETSPGSGSPSTPAALSSGAVTLPGGSPGVAHERGATRDLAPARSRRAGLGAPLSVPPAGAVAQRQPAAGATPPPAIGAGASPGNGPAGPAGGAETPGPASGATATAASGRPLNRPAGRGLPVLPVARRRHADGTDAASSPAATTPATPATPGPAPVTLPTLGVRPLRPMVIAQRRAAGDEGPPAAAPVPARWVAPATLPDRIRLLPQPTGETAGDGAPVELSPARPGGPGPGSPTPGASAVREIVFPPPEDLLAAGSSAPATPGVQRSMAVPSPSEPDRPLPPMAAARPAALSGPVVAPGPVRGRAADRPLTLARLPATAAAAGPATAAPGSTVGWIVADPTNPGGPPTVQASRPASGATPVATFTATPVVQREEAPAPAAQPAKSGHTDAELDELARALFGRIRGHLKSEVIHEREAKGLSFDAF